MKRFIILFLTLIHCYLSYAQLIVASCVEIDGIYYNLYDDNTCQVSRNYAVRYEGDMVIPETIEYQGTTYTVTEIGNCLADDLTSVSIPKTVTSISSHAFEVVGTTECSLENYYVAEDNPIFTSVDGVIYNKKKDLLCRFPHGRKGAYRVLDNTLQICSEAFCGSVNLTEITLPASFEDFTYSEAISYTYMGVVGPEFTGCNQLKNINMDPSGKEWGYLSVDGVLYHCANRGFIWQTEELCEWVGSNVWYVWTLSQYPPGRTDETYYIPDAPDICNVMQIESLNGASYLQNIENINMPFAIGIRACYNCSALKQLDFSDVLYIGTDAFYYCSSLKSVDLSHSPLRTLPQNAFADCTSLDEIILPPMLEQIKDGALSGCSSLKECVVPATVTDIGLYVFSWCMNLEKLIVETDNPVYDSREECNAIIETSTNTLICGSPTTVIPESVTHIADYAFFYSNIHELTIPASVESIGDFALYFIQPEYKKTHKIICLRPTPPMVEPRTFLDPSEVVIHVLPGCKEAYKLAEVWGDYTIVDDAGEENGIQNIELETNNSIYNLMGHRINKNMAPHSIIIQRGKKYLINRH